MPEVHGHAAAQHDADDAEDGAKSAEKRQRLVFADHTEDGAHHLDAVSYGVKLADGSGRTVAVLNWHLEQTQVVVQRVDGHFSFDFKAARQHWVSLHKSEGERSVASHDIGYVSSEQSIDGSTYEPIAEVVEWPLVLLEVRGAQTITNHHVVALENLVDHSRCCIGRVRIVAVRHDVHVSIDIFEHGSNDIALALTRFLTYDSALAGRDFRRAVGGVVVIHVNVGARQCCLEITHYLADGDFLVIARQQYGNGGACILLEHVEHYSLCCGRSEASCGFNYDCCLLGKGYERMA